MPQTFTRRKFIALSAAAVASAAAAGAGFVNYLQQPPAAASTTSVLNGDVTTMLQINDQNEKNAVEAAMAKVQALGRTPRIVATSPSGVSICDKLEMELVGVCSSTLHKTPKRYKDLPKVGTAMAPDMEIVKSLSPDWVLSPDSLSSDLKPKYEAAGLDYAFMNLRSVQGMYMSIEELGQIFGYEDQAAKLTKEFTDFYTAYQKSHATSEHPKVLALMGLPGSYIIATPNSYVGSLVELAGGQNVYSDTDQEFMTVNTEDMKTKEPDVIVRAAHALPDQVKKMFQDEFKTNDIWKHFDAVQNDRVYDLPYKQFGMSATFNYPKALKTLEGMLYPSTKAEKAKGGDGTA